MLNDALAALFFFVLAVIGWATNVIWLIWLYVQTHALDLGIVAFVGMILVAIAWIRSRRGLADDEDI